MTNIAINVLEINFNVHFNKTMHESFYNWNNSTKIRIGTKTEISPLLQSNFHLIGLFMV